MTVEHSSPLVHSVLDLVVESRLSAEVAAKSSSEARGQSNVMPNSESERGFSKLLVIVVVDCSETGNPVEATPSSVLEGSSESGVHGSFVEEEPESLVIGVLVVSFELELFDGFVGVGIAESDSSIKFFVSSRPLVIKGEFFWGCHVKGSVSPELDVHVASVNQLVSEERQGSRRILVQNFSSERGSVVSIIESR